MMRRARILALAMQIAGCSTTPDVWVMRGVTHAEFDRDVAQCQFAVLSLPQIPARPEPENASGLAGVGAGLTALGAGLQNRDRQKQGFRYCMQGKGYTLREPD